MEGAQIQGARLAELLRVRLMTEGSAGGVRALGLCCGRQTYRIWIYRDASTCIAAIFMPTICSSHQFI